MAIMQISLVGSSGQYPCSKELLDPVVVLRSESGGSDVVRFTVSQLCRSDLAITRYSGA